MSQTQWAFVNSLKEQEAAELKGIKIYSNFSSLFNNIVINSKILVFNRDRAGSPTKENKTGDSKGASKTAKPKPKPKGTSGTTSGLSRPASSLFDITKPHWTLKWVSDSISAVN